MYVIVKYAHKADAKSQQAYWLVDRPNWYDRFRLATNRWKSRLGIIEQVVLWPCLVAPPIVAAVWAAVALFRASEGDTFINTVLCGLVGVLVGALTLLLTSLICLGIDDLISHYLHRHVKKLVRDGMLIDVDKSRILTLARRELKVSSEEFAHFIGEHPQYEDQLSKLLKNETLRQLYANLDSDAVRNDTDAYERTEKAIEALVIKELSGIRAMQAEEARIKREQELAKERADQAALEDARALAAKVLDETTIAQDCRPTAA